MTGDFCGGGATGLCRVRGRRPHDDEKYRKQIYAGFKASPAMFCLACKFTTQAIESMTLLQLLSTDVYKSKFIIFQFLY